MICHPLKWGWMDWPKVQPGATGLLRLWMLQVGRVRPVQILFVWDFQKVRWALGCLWCFLPWPLVIGDGCHSTELMGRFFGLFRRPFGCLENSWSQTSSWCGRVKTLGASRRWGVLKFIGQKSCCFRSVSTQVLICSFLTCKSSAAVYICSFLKVIVAWFVAVTMKGDMEARIQDVTQFMRLHSWHPHDKWWFWSARAFETVDPSKRLDSQQSSGTEVSFPELLDIHKTHLDPHRRNWHLPNHPTTAPSQWEVRWFDEGHRPGKAASWGPDPAKKVENPCCLREVLLTSSGENDAACMCLRQAWGPGSLGVVAVRGIPGWQDWWSLDLSWDLIWWK